MSASWRRPETYPTVAEASFPARVIEDPSAAFGVCMLATDVDAPTGGVQAQSFRLLKQLHRRGVATFLCVRNYHARASDEQRDGTRIHRSPTVARSVPALNSLLYLIDGLGWLISNRKGFDVIHCQQMFGPAMLGLFARTVLRKPVLVRVTSTGSLGEVRHLHGMVFSQLRRRQLRGVDLWIALTNDMRDEILTLGVRRETVVVIPNGVEIPAESATDDAARMRARSFLGVNAERIVVYTGRLSIEKGIDTLLHAWVTISRQHPDARLLLLGAGGTHRNVEPQLRALMTSLHLESTVRFLGHVGNVADYLIAADVFVLPTTSEGMSNSLLEAMAAGTAIVSTAIPAHEGILADGYDALLVNPGDASALSVAVSRILSTPELRTRLGKAARTKAEREFSVEVVADRYIEQYARLHRA